MPKKIYQSAGDKFDGKIIAYHDKDFLDSDFGRPVRLLLEYLKPEVMMQDRRINDTVCIFGSARTLSPEQAAKELRQAKAALKKAKPGEKKLCQAAVDKCLRRQEDSKYYAMAREFARLVAGYEDKDGGKRFTVVTGGGPGIMEAGNQGARDAGAQSVGVNITLPFEQEPNPYISDGLCFQMHYFCIRKIHFIKRCKALAAFPVGFGTMDEVFESLTLIQTGIIPRIPVVLFGRKFWEDLVDWQCFLDRGLISPEDMSLFKYCDTAAEGWQIVKDFYKLP
ncbi:MAG: LOG family protein [Victivallales bacterium]|nr:LOG family protein [Victivallales bacterium]